MTIFKIFVKEKHTKDITLKKFLEEYQKITLSFLKEIKKLQKSNEDKIIEKLMSMVSCSTMPEYQIMIKQDLLELLQIHQVYPMNTKINESFDPNKHRFRRTLNSNEEYVITKVYEDGFMRENEILQKAIVEVGRRTYE